jgi:hypothetical protein
LAHPSGPVATSISNGLWLIPASLPLLRRCLTAGRDPEILAASVLVRLACAGRGRGTYGSRTRVLRSHNPPTLVVTGCCWLQNRLI